MGILFSIMYGKTTEYEEAIKFVLNLDLVYGICIFSRKTTECMKRRESVDSLTIFKLQHLLKGYRVNEKTKECLQETSTN